MAGGQSETIKKSCACVEHQEKDREDGEGGKERTFSYFVVDSGGA